MIRRVEQQGISLAFLEAYYSFLLVGVWPLY